MGTTSPGAYKLNVNGSIIGTGVTINRTLAMTDGVCVHHAATFFLNSMEVVHNLLRLQISGNGYTDETMLRFLPEAMAEFDGSYDAHKLFGDVPEAPQIYTLGSTELSINSMPKTSQVSVGLGVGVSSKFTIAATELRDLQYVTLEDTKTNTLPNLPITGILLAIPQVKMRIVFCCISACFRFLMSTLQKSIYTVSPKPHI